MVKSKNSPHCPQMLPLRPESYSVFPHRQFNPYSYVSLGDNPAGSFDKGKSLVGKIWEREQKYIKSDFSKKVTKFMPLSI